MPDRYFYLLGIRMTGMKYIRFRDSGQSDQVKMTELLNTILATLPLSGSLICANLSSSLHHQPAPHPIHNVIQSTTATFRSVNQWTSTDGDILAWFTSNEISIELHDLFNFRIGEEMLDYAQLLIEDRRQQMNIYAKIFAQKYHGNELPPHEFNRFAKALEQLLKENRPSVSVTNPNASVPIKSGACTVL
ncbi:unnamed protein product [Rotaria sp. Silwood2]|nr:unnamed protein product [Rotaria sp. Silwood2]CAF3086081.1 unnamed protein product [Rotaria sp. Silwood2]CAF4489236.1 unnamed protein product [Rotaria sp. Silwood2]